LLLLLVWEFEVCADHLLNAHAILKEEHLRQCGQMLLHVDTFAARSVPARGGVRERALALIRQGYATETAASVVGCTGRALRNHLRQSGVTARTLRGPGVAVLVGRFPCRYCGQPARSLGGVCEAALCRCRAWKELPEEERTARVDERRRGDKYAPHVGQGRRVAVHILLSPEEAEQLREQAASRGQSISSLVAETLAEAGLIAP